MRDGNYQEGGRKPFPVEPVNWEPCDPLGEREVTSSGPIYTGPGAVIPTEPHRDPAQGTYRHHDPYCWGWRPHPSSPQRLRQGGPWDQGSPSSDKPVTCVLSTPAPGRSCPVSASLGMRVRELEGFSGRQSIGLADTAVLKQTRARGVQEPFERKRRMEERHGGKRP